MNPGPAISTRARCARRIRLEDGRDAAGGFARRHARALRDLQRHVGGPVAVVALLRGFERDATGRLGEAGSVERAAHGVDEGFADHTTHISWTVLTRLVDGESYWRIPHGPGWYW